MTLRASGTILLVVVTLILPAQRAGGAGPVGPTPKHAVGPVGSVPAGLPPHLMLGLANDPGSLSWMTGSGARWDARYQYLAGGVNTGHGWATWNSPGAFALWYMQASGAQGYLPVFSYYQLLQSNPAGGSSEAEKDYSNLNSAATMKAYYTDFALLLRQARAYGKPVIVHVEPDLWGYMEQRAGRCGLASCVSAAVAASGYAAVAAYPNTVQGFAEALLHLRDTIAPNVLMAIHASCWGSMFDVCTYPTSLADTTRHAAHDAAFLASAGIARNPRSLRPWDLVFTDTSDRDAGYYQYVEGNSHTWWDPTNRALPNFVNFRRYVAAINAGTGLRVVLWQTPLGNQYFDSENNTNGHYQDNRAQYFLGDGPGYAHLRAFANAGVIGLLFGAGASGPTTNTDARGDGITNPAPVDSFQCHQCNTHVSRYSDDDGGYLRLFGGAYLRAGGVSIPRAGSVPAPMSTPSGGVPTTLPTPVHGAPAPPPATPVASLAASFTRAAANPARVVPGATEQFTATITVNRTLSGELVDFEVYTPSGAKYWQTWRSPVGFRANVPRTFTAREAIKPGMPTGRYTLKLGLFTAAWGFQAWDNGATTFAVAPARS